MTVGKFGIAGPPRAVVGKKVDYMVVPGEASGYRWDVTGGFIVEGQDMPAITVEWYEAGKHHVDVHIETETGQVVKDRFSVVVNNEE